MTAFTVCEAYIVAYACASVNDPTIVVAASFFTAVMVLSLTIYAITTNKDFTVCGGLAFIISIGLLVLGLVCAFIGPRAYLFYCFLAVCAFGFYLLIDT
jgi:FtsH-binding integral membrane protein